MGRTFSHIKGLILLPMLVLTGFSLSVIASINPELLQQQALFFLIGYILFFLFSFMDRDVLKNLGWFFYGFSLVVLLISYFGPSIRGSTRWIYVLGMQIQPSEVVKPLLLMSQAMVLSRYKKMSYGNAFVFFILFLLPIILVFKQPDLGNSIVYFGTLMGLLFISGAPLFFFGGFLGFFSLLLPVGWIILKDYQRFRIISFLNPYIDTKGAGYNAIQAMIAVGTGQIFGRGLGRGTQSQLRFLPENHTDFIFASLSEELGFVAATFVLGSYFLILIMLISMARASYDRFSRFFIFGAFFQIFLHVIINAGMNLGILPITGITLPLVSYGGSSIIGISMTLGLVHALYGGKKVRNTIAIG